VQAVEDEEADGFLGKNKRADCIGAIPDAINIR